MARSSTFDALIRWARDHREAQVRGTDIQTVRTQRSQQRSSGLSRRGFLGALGVGGAAMLLPRIANAAGTSSPRIAIIGGGVSGLAAALTLSDAGLADNLTVYAAQNRLGGRMFSNTPAIGGTAYWTDNQVSEWCGELVDSGHATIMTLCQRYSLTLDDIAAAEPANSNPVYMFDGTYYTLDELLVDFPPVLAQVQSDIAAAVPSTKSDDTPNDDGTVLYNAITDAGIALDNISVYQWIETNVPGGHSSNLGKLLDLAYASEYGADTTDQSALNLVLLLGGLPDDVAWAPFGASDERYHISGGNQQLPLAIAADLQTKLGAEVIQMNSRLTSIAVNADNTIALTFSVTSAGTTTTTTVEADAVILTLPFAVLADAVADDEAARVVPPEGVATKPTDTEYHDAVLTTSKK